MLAVGGHIPVGYYKDEKKSESTFRVINGTRWSVPGDYAVAGRSLPLYIVIATVFATWFGSETVLGIPATL